MASVLIRIMFLAVSAQDTMKFKSKKMAVVRPEPVADTVVAVPLVEKAYMVHQLSFTCMLKYWTGASDEDAEAAWERLARLKQSYQNMVESAWILPTGVKGGTVIRKFETEDDLKLRQQEIQVCIERYKVGYYGFLGQLQ